MPASGDPAAAKVVIDPNVLDPSGKTAIDFFVPSPDGRRVAVSLSKGGTESGDVQVIDVESGASSDAIARVNGGTAGGDLAWTHDGKAFYYTRYPAPGERPGCDLDFYQQLYFHRLGTDPRDRPLRVRQRPAAHRRDPRERRSLAPGACSWRSRKATAVQFAHYLKAQDRRLAPADALRRRRGAGRVRSRATTCSRSRATIRRAAWCCA